MGAPPQSRFLILSTTGPDRVARTRQSERDNAAEREHDWYGALRVIFVTEGVPQAQRKRTWVIEDHIEHSLLLLHEMRGACYGLISMTGFVVNRQAGREWVSIRSLDISHSGLARKIAHNNLTEVLTFATLLDGFSKDT